LRFDTLDAWLDWQITLNPAEIDLGLDRIARVLDSAGLKDTFDCPLITVAGTNGKGSVVAMIESIALAAGLRVCSYTSPHLLRYNERIRIDGTAVTDDALCAAFDFIDRARGDVALTYFEFGTLAAIRLFLLASPDLVVLEVGLGGRLDAVNVMQPDVAVVTAIDIDHTDWLGNDREAIGFEKAGIFRSGKAAICADTSPPASLLQHASAIGASLWLCGRDYQIQAQPDSWTLRVGEDAQTYARPALAGEFQLANAAAAVLALRLAIGDESCHDTIDIGLRKVSLAGRYQTLQRGPEVIVDVAHNRQAIESLVTMLETRPCGGRTHAVIGMLADKPYEAAVRLLWPLVDCWYSAGLESVLRGLSAQAMAQAIRAVAVEQQRADVKLCAESTVTSACEQAAKAALPDDRIIVLGSFYTVADAMRYFGVQQQDY
jgi:dihydrofolate synthase / folylpolyglutamate synthase